MSSAILTLAELAATVCAHCLEKLVTAHPELAPPPPADEEDEILAEEKADDTQQKYGSPR